MSNTTKAETLREYWERLVGRFVANASPDVRRRIVDECVRTASLGAPCGVWHAFNQVAERPCGCYACRPDDFR
jgi:hypothetical protein